MIREWHNEQATMRSMKFAETQTARLTPADGQLADHMLRRLRLATRTTGQQLLIIAPLAFGDKRPSPSRFLNDDSRAVCKHLGNAVHHLVRIVSHADDGVLADLLRVLQH